MTDSPPVPIAFALVPVAALGLTRPDRYGKGNEGNGT